MKLTPLLLLTMKTLALIACICFADQSRGLRDNQKNGLPSIGEVTSITASVTNIARVIYWVPDWTNPEPEPEPEPMYYGKGGKSGYGGDYGYGYGSKGGKSMPDQTLSLSLSLPHWPEPEHPKPVGLNKGCVSAPLLGSIETYTPKYDEQSACCSFHYSWDVATCMGATVLPPSGWYPAWTLGINKCLADGNQPEYMSKNPTQYLFPDRQACCTKHYSWSLTTCLFDSDSTDLGDLQWYIVDWTRQTGGTCVMNCPGDNSDCGGLAKPWDTLWSSKEECCKKMKWWDSSCETN